MGSVATGQAGPPTDCESSALTPRYRQLRGVRFAWSASMVALLASGLAGCGKGESSSVESLPPDCVPESVPSAGDSDEIVQALLRAGRVLREGGDYSAAHQRFLEAAALRPGDPEVGGELMSSLDETCSWLRAGGRESEAREVVRRTTESHRAARVRLEQALAAAGDPFAPGLSDPARLDSARILADLAAVLRQLGEFSAARARMEQAVSLRERLLPPDDPARAADCFSLAILLQDLNDLPAARARMERATSIREKILPEGGPDLADSYFRLAQILRGTDDLADAPGLLERAIAMDRRFRGEDHPVEAGRWFVLGLALQELGREGEAADAMREAVRIRRLKLPEWHRERILAERLLTRFEEAAPRTTSSPDAD